MVGGWCAVVHARFFAFSEAVSLSLELIFFCIKIVSYLIMSQIDVG